MSQGHTMHEAKLLTFIHSAGIPRLGRKKPLLGFPFRPLQALHRKPMLGFESKCLLGSLSRPMEGHPLYHQWDKRTDYSGLPLRTRGNSPDR